MLMLHPEYSRQDESGPSESGIFGEGLFEACCEFEIRFALSSSWFCDSTSSAPRLEVVDAIERKWFGLEVRVKIFN